MAEIEDPKKHEEREKKRKKNLTILLLLLILLVLLLCCLMGAPWRGYWFIGDLVPSPEPQKAVETILPTATLTELPDIKIVIQTPVVVVESTVEKLAPTETPIFIMTPLPVNTPKLSGGMVSQYILDAIPTKESVETMNIPKLWKKESYPIVAAALTERGLEFPLGTIGRYIDQSTVAYLCHKDYVADDGEVLYDACGILYVLQKGDSVYINGEEYVVTGKTSVIASQWWDTARTIPISLSSCAPGYDREKKEYTHRLVVTIEKKK